MSQPPTFPEDITEKEREELLEVLNRAAWLQTKLATLLAASSSYFIYRAHDAIWPASRHSPNPRPEPGEDLRAAGALMDKLAEAVGLKYEPKRSAWGECGITATESEFPWLRIGPDRGPTGKPKAKRRKAPKKISKKVKAKVRSGSSAP